MLLASVALLSTPWRTLYSSRFRIDLGPANYVAAVSSKPWIGGSAGPVVIDLYEFEEKKKRLKSSTIINESVTVHTVHAIAVRSNRPKFTQWFLTTLVNGGQFDHLLVWKF